MGELSKIQWTDNTFNPWRGCEKVSPACMNCYAAAGSLRNPKVLGEWGRGSKRVIGTDKYWKKPLSWNAQAEAEGRRIKVFCLSYGDVFEDRADLIPHRTRLFSLIEQTPYLDWLLLTKRPHIAARWALALQSAGREWPRHAWIGATVERQVEAEERLPWLTRVPAPVRFLSCEPLLGPLDLQPWLWTKQTGDSGAWTGFYDQPRGGLHWIIAGGESGPGARLTRLEWLIGLKEQARVSGVPFFMKQTGKVLGRRLGDSTPKGDDMSTWPRGLQQRAFPVVSP